MPEYIALFHSCQVSFPFIFAPFGQCMYVHFFSVVIFYNSKTTATSGGTWHWNGQMISFIRFILSQPVCFIEENSWSGTNHLKKIGQSINVHLDVGKV